MSNAPKVHYLKSEAEQFQLIKSKTKRFELRADDRGFSAGDFLMLQEYLPDQSILTGKQLLVRVNYILKDTPKWGLRPNFACMGLEFFNEMSDENKAACNEIMMEAMA